MSAGASVAAAAEEPFQRFAAREIAPLAGSFDREERVPASVIAKLAEAGYLGAVIPIEYGGAGMDMVTLGVLHEEIGRACSSVRSLLTVQSMVAYAILKWGRQKMRDHWLPQLASGDKLASFALSERNAGSDARSMETTAVLMGDHYSLEGHKRWITFGQIANVFLVFAQCEGKISALLVERDCPGVSIHAIDGMLGTRGSMLAEIRFAECKIPKENLVGGIGFGLSAVCGSALDLGRYSVACGCVGIIQACLDASLSYAGSRKQFGVAIKEHQLIARLIGQMSVDAKAARLLCRSAGTLKDAGDPDTIGETLAAKYFASTAAMRAASNAVQIHGAAGCSPGHPVERYFRDAKVMEIIEGSTQLQEIMIAQDAYQRHGGVA